MDRIIVAFASEKSQSQITRLLESGGIYPAGCCLSGAEAIRMVWNLGSAVVVCGFKLRDMTAEELASDLRGIGAVLVIASPAHLDFCTGENLFKLAVPASRADLFASLQLLQDFESRSLQHPGGAAPGDEPRLVRQAKELLMDVHHMTEAEAHRFLQRRSMNTGLKLTEIARLILAEHL